MTGQQAIIIWFCMAGALCVIELTRPFGKKWLDAISKMEEWSHMGIGFCMFLAWLMMTAPLAFIFWLATRAAVRR